MPFIEKVLDINEITCLISDNALSYECKKKLEKSGVKVMLGSNEPS